MRRACDVMVIGGGPAGLTAAITCALRGMTVTVIDPVRPPIDKACGEGILPDGLLALRELGVEFADGESARLRGIHFLSGDSETKAEFTYGFGAGVRRTTLHARLMARATELGVELRWGSRAEDISERKAMVDGQEFPFEFGVIADGQNSIWRERLEFGAFHVKRQRFGFRKHLRVAPWSEFVEVYWRDGAQMYVTPVGEREVGVALLTSDQHANFERELKHFPALDRRLTGAETCSKLRGAASVTRTVTHVTRDNLALIGDASGSVDAITGDGISIAVHQAAALAEAISKRDLDEYEDAHRRIMRRPRRMGELLLALDRHPRFRERALSALARHPETFGKFVGLHTGAIQVAEFGIKDAMVLGWELLAG